MKFKKYIAALAAGMIIFGAQTLRAQEPAQLHAWLPQVAGWTVSDDIEVFDANNLFERINGAAPLFLENNFREMTSMQYTKGEDYITIQAYRHASPRDAFGMYASERSSGLTFFPYGGEAQGDDKNMYFFAGNIYVKMWSSAPDDVSETLGQIAKGFAAKIDPDAGYPAVLTAFPAGDRVPYSQAYITSSYIGHEFLKSVYTVNYKIGDDKFQAFVIDAGSKEDAAQILGKWFAFAKQTAPAGEGVLLVKDRYNGEIPLLWKGRYVAGIFSGEGKTMPAAENFLQKIAGNLPE